MRVPEGEWRRRREGHGKGGRKGGKKDWRVDKSSSARKLERRKK